MRLRVASVAATAVYTLAISGSTLAVQRTFVGSTGNDGNPCSLTLPCRGFAAAVAAVDAGGEVVVLDSAGYGPVAITRSVSIIAPPGVYAGISVPASGNATGVSIATPAVRATLRGLTINGIGGNYGVHMSAGSELAIENCVISNFPYGAGVLIEAPAKVSISGSIVQDNGDAIVAGNGATVTISGSQVAFNSSAGITLTGGSNGSLTQIYVSDTVVSGSYRGIWNHADDGTTGQINVVRVTVADCLMGVQNNIYGGGTTTVGYSAVSGSVVGFSNMSGTFYSLGNNLLSNSSGMDTSGPITTIGGK